MATGSSANCVSLTENILQQYEVLRNEVGELRGISQRPTLNGIDPQL